MSLDRKNLRGPLLRSVSRSFYLSLRILPGPLRDPLTLGYLLARATDTIADTPEPSIAIRTKALRELAAAIQGAAEKGDDAGSSYKSRSRRFAKR